MVLVIWMIHFSNYNKIKKKTYAKYLVFILSTIIITIATNVIINIILQNDYLVSILCKVDPPFPSPSHEFSPHLSHPSIFPLSLTFKQFLLNIPPCFPLSLLTFSHFLNLFLFHWISAFHFTLPRTRRSLKEICGIKHNYPPEIGVVFELTFCLLKLRLSGCTVRVLILRLSVYFCFCWG